MRTVTAVLIVAALGGLFLWQKKGDRTPPTAETAVAQHSAPSPAAVASPAREVSEHNWMKRSLDRARDVRDQARKQTKDGQDP